ncbi:MAG: hypothetical protein HYX90_05050 [Chloroflexi bacterium]|nr:hypothetical protein [Chloroflexota bacterium]
MARIERAGIPTVTVAREGFTQILTSAFAGLGFPREAPHVVFPYKMFLPDADLALVDENIHMLIDGLTKWQPKTKERKTLVVPKKITIGGRDYEEAQDNMNRMFLKNSWGDGLPLLPPTKERVNWMLAGTDASPDQVVGKILPRGGVATIEVVATSLAMAGGRPEYLPVLIAAVEAFTAPLSRHERTQTTTCNVYPIVIVNGPAAKQIHLNSRDGCLGPHPAHPAGASIGRALRLLQQNVGGAVPGSGTMAGFGGPARYTNIVFAEDEDGLPSDWTPLNVERGFPRGSNTVTVYAVSSTSNVNGSAAETEEAALWTLNSLAAYMRAPNRNYFQNQYASRLAGVILMGGLTARGFSKLGWSKEKVRSFLWDNAKIPWADLMKAGGGYEEDRLKAPKEYWQDPMPIAATPDKILIVVAGGYESRQNYWMQAGQGPEACVSVEVKLPAAWNDLLAKAQEDG